MNSHKGHAGHFPVAGNGRARGEPVGDRAPRSIRAVTGGGGLFRQWCRMRQYAYLQSDH